MAYPSVRDAKSFLSEEGTGIPSLAYAIIVIVAGKYAKSETILNLTRLLQLKLCGGVCTRDQKCNAPLYFRTQNETYGTLPKKGARPY